MKFYTPKTSAKMSKTFFLTCFFTAQAPSEMLWTSKQLFEGLRVEWGWNHPNPPSSRMAGCCCFLTNGTLLPFVQTIGALGTCRFCWGCLVLVHIPTISKASNGWIAGEKKVKLKGKVQYAGWLFLGDGCLDCLKTSEWFLPGSIDWRMHK